MSGILLQLATDADRELLSLTRAHHRWYAWRHGLEYLCVEANPAAPKRSGWGKVTLVLLAMRMGFERIVWLDADAVIFDATIDLSRLVDRGIGMVRHPSPDHWSSGVMVVVTSQATLNFFQAVHAEPENETPWMERPAINAVAERPEFAGLFVRLAAAYNSVPGSAVAASPVVYAAYGLPHATRRELILRWLKDLPASEHSSAAAVPEVHFREDLAGFLNRRGLLGEAAEIGVQRGGFSRAFLDRWQGKLLHLVDPWRHFAGGYQDVGNVTDAEHEANLHEAERNLAAHLGRYRIHRQPSQEAVGAFADDSLDFVYIDANHEYPAVLQDIRSWFRKVRLGGVLAGHDYLDGTLTMGEFGVKSAVRAFECETGLIARGTLEPQWPSWYLVKPNR